MTSKAKSGNLNLFLGILLFFPLLSLQFSRKKRAKYAEKGLDYQILPFLKKSRDFSRSGTNRHRNRRESRELRRCGGPSGKKRVSWGPPAQCPKVRTESHKSQGQVNKGHWAAAHGGVPWSTKLLRTLCSLMLP